MQRLNHLAMDMFRSCKLQPICPNIYNTEQPQQLHLQIPSKSSALLSSSSPLIHPFPLPQSTNIPPSPSINNYISPMTKQLQDKILRLQTQKNQQQDQFTKKKQHYEAIIQSLQAQNQKLRKYIEENSESISLIESQTKSVKLESPVREYERSKLVPDDQKDKIPQYEEIALENRMLKQELVNLTQTYEQQIEQMSNYFNKIQEVYTTLSQKVTNMPKEGQINDLVNAYENLLKDFQSQRLKYIGKIEELTNYIVQSQEKYKQMEQESSKIEIELKIVKEELKIYKRSKIIK